MLSGFTAGHERQCYQGSRQSEYIKKYDCFSGSGWHACNNIVKTCQVGAFALSGGYYSVIILLHVKKTCIECLHVVDISLEQLHEISIIVPISQVKQMRHNVV